MFILYATPISGAIRFEPRNFKVIKQIYCDQGRNGPDLVGEMVIHSIHMCTCDGQSEKLSTSSWASWVFWKIQSKVDQMFWTLDSSKRCTTAIACSFLQVLGSGFEGKNTKQLNQKGPPASTSWLCLATTSNHYIICQPNLLWFATGWNSRSSFLGSNAIAVKIVESCSRAKSPLQNKWCAWIMTAAWLLQPALPEMIHQPCDSGSLGKDAPEHV